MSNASSSSPKTLPASKSEVASAGDVNAAAASVTSKRGGGVRGFPLWALALSGAALAGGYGHWLLSMRLGPPLVMVALGGMTLALCAAALWRVIDPLTRTEVAAATAIRAPQRLRELEREKQAVLKAIKEIELDYQMRKISETDYREMVERYRARALRVMGDLATGDDYKTLIERELRARLAARAAVTARESSEGDPVPPRARAAPADGRAALRPEVGDAGCVRCGATNDADARFCKKCGNLLTVSPDRA